MKQISKKHSTKIDYQGNIVYAKTVSIQVSLITMPTTYYPRINLKKHHDNS